MSDSLDLLGDDPFLWPISTEYDRLADERDLIAGERDEVAVERDRLGELRDALAAAGTPGEDWIARITADRVAAARDRARAAEDRRRAARDRERAARDRRRAMSRIERLRVELAELVFRNDELRRADALRHAFLLAVAHDLRSPVTALLGFGELLERRLDELSPQQVRETAGRITISARHMQVVLDNLLDMERVRAGHMRLRLAEVDLVGIMRDCIARLEITDHEVAIEPDTFEAEVDAGLIERIVENLLLNAVRHTPVGSRVVFRLSRIDGAVSIACDDEGPGVPEELKAVIFEPFRQGGGGAGLGLGLFLVRCFAELHGGQVRVSDRPGGGASFVVRLGRPVPRPVLVAASGAAAGSHSLVLP